MNLNSVVIKELLKVTRATTKDFRHFGSWLDMVQEWRVNDHKKKYINDLTTTLQNVFSVLTAEDVIQLLPHLDIRLIQSIDFVRLSQLCEKYSKDVVLKIFNPIMKQSIYTWSEITEFLQHNVDLQKVLTSEDHVRWQDNEFAKAFGSDELYLAWKKESSLPKALIIRATDDHNGAFSFANVHSR